MSTLLVRSSRGAVSVLLASLVRVTHGFLSSLDCAKKSLVCSFDWVHEGLLSSVVRTAGVA